MKPVVLLDSTDFADTNTSFKVMPFIFFMIAITYKDAYNYFQPPITHVKQIGGDKCSLLLIFWVV